MTHFYIENKAMNTLTLFQNRIELFSMYAMEELIGIINVVIFG